MPCLWWKETHTQIHRQTETDKISLVLSIWHNPNFDGGFILFCFVLFCFVLLSFVLFFPNKDLFCKPFFVNDVLQKNICCSVLFFKVLFCFCYVLFFKKNVMFFLNSFVLFCKSFVLFCFVSFIYFEKKIFCFAIFCFVFCTIICCFCFVL